MWGDDNEVNSDSSKDGSTDSDITIQSEKGDNSNDTTSQSNSDDNDVVDELSDITNIPTKNKEKSNLDSQGEKTNQNNPEQEHPSGNDTTVVNSENADEISQESKGDADENTGRLNWEDGAKRDPSPTEENEEGLEEDTSELGREDEFDNDSPPEEISSILTRISWPRSKKIGRNEDVIKAANPSKFSMFYTYLAGSIIFLVSLVALLYWIIFLDQPIIYEVGPFGIEGTWPNMTLLNILLGFIVATIVIATRHIQRKFKWYILTDQRIYVRQGVIDKSDVCNIKYRNLTDLRENEPYKDRIFGVGHIKLFTASSDGAEAVMKGLNNSSEWMTIIRGRADDRQKKVETRDEIQ